MSVDFSKFGLNAPPFETYTHDYEMAGRRTEWKTLTKIVQRYFERGGCQFIVLLGAYGQGKSYTVYRVYKRFSEEFEEFPRTLVVKTIRGSPIRAMEPEPSVSQFGLDLICRIFANIGKDKLHQIAQSVDKEKLLRVEHRDSKRLFSALGSEDDELVESAFLLLTGEAQREDTKAVKIGRMIRSSERALKIYYDFLRLIKYADYDHMLLLLDEFEYVIGIQSSKQITKILATFRSMFDDIGSMYNRSNRSIASVVIVFAISPDAWHILTELERSLIEKTGGGGVAPFMQRLRRDSYVTLQPFSVEDTKELIKIRLSAHRISEKKLENELYPFSEEAVEYLHEKGQMTPRTILQLAGIVLEDAITNKLEKIEKEDVETILEKYPIPMVTRAT